MAVASVTFEYLSGGARTLPVCLSYPVLSDYFGKESLQNAEGLRIPVALRNYGPISLISNGSASDRGSRRTGTLLVNQHLTGAHIDGQEA